MFESNSGGVKHDAGKAQVSLIPLSAIKAEARVLAFGAEKYGRGNWRLGMAWSRLIDAALRHVLAFADGEQIDEESGLLHLAHAKTCLSFLIEYATTHPEMDDRHNSHITSNLMRGVNTGTPTPTAEMLSSRSATRVASIRERNSAKFYKNWKWDNDPDSLDAAYERKALEEGSTANASFECNGVHHLQPILGRGPFWEATPRPPTQNGDTGKVEEG